MVHSTGFRLWFLTIFAISVSFGSTSVGQPKEEKPTAKEDSKKTTMDFRDCCVLEKDKKRLIFVAQKVELYAEGKNGTVFQQTFTYDKGFDAKIAVVFIKVNLERNGWVVEDSGDFGFVIRGHKKKNQDLSPLTRIGVFAEGAPAGTPKLVIEKGVKRGFFKDGKWGF